MHMNAMVASSIRSILFFFSGLYVQVRGRSTQQYSNWTSIYNMLNSTYHVNKIANYKLLAIWKHIVVMFGNEQKRCGKQLWVKGKQTQQWHTVSTSRTTRVFACIVTLMDFITVNAIDWYNEMCLLSSNTLRMSLVCCSVEAAHITKPNWIGLR